MNREVHGIILLELFFFLNFSKHVAIFQGLAGKMANGSHSTNE